MTTDADLEYKATLNPSDMERAFKLIQKAAEDTAKRAGVAYTSLEVKLHNNRKVTEDATKATKKFGEEAETAGKKSSKGAGESGIKLGIVSGIVQELTRRFIELGERAAQAFAQVIIGGIELNNQAQLIKISLTSIFEGNQGAADAFLSVMDKAAVRLGASRQELRALGKSILPDVGSIDKTVELIEKATILGRDAGIGMESVRIALEEALASGGEGAGLISLQRRLNIPPDVIRRIRESSKEVGIVDALLQQLGARVEKSGLGIENFADSFAVALGTVKSDLADLQALLTKAAFDELTGALQDMGEAFEGNRDEIEGFILAVGDSLAKLADFAGEVITGLIKDTDFKRLALMSQQVAMLVENLRTFYEILSTPGESSTNGLIGTINGFILLNTGLEGTFGWLVQIKALLEGLNIDNLILPILTISKGGGIGLIKEIENIRKEGIFDQEEYNNVLGEAKKRQEEHNKRTQEYLDLLKERTNAVEADTDAAKAQGDATLAQKEALEALNDAESKAKEARGKIDEEQKKAATDLQRDLLKIAIDGELQRLDDLIDAAQKREDIARKNAEEIADIFRKHYQKIADGALDLSREEQDVAIKSARAAEEAETEKASRQIEIERNYRRELERIRNQFNQDAAEAERNNDAQAFVAAIRRRDSAVDEAKLSRDQENEDATGDAEKKRSELKKSLEYEIEDARLANQRKLEDLQIALQRELEEQSLKNQHELDEQTIHEERLAQQRILEHERELQDLRVHLAQKLADLTASLQAEFEAVQTYEKMKSDYIINKAVETQNRLQQLFNPGGAAARVAASTPGQQTRSGVSAGTRRKLHSGGRIGAGETAIVQPEREAYFTAPANGFVAPTSRMFAGNSGGTTNTYSRQATIENLNVGKEMAYDAILQRMVENVVDEKILKHLA